jgi:1,4-alpha-glucan branching enzyme
VAGNGGGVSAEAGPMHGFAQSASLVLPANSVLVFAR